MTPTKNNAPSFEEARNRRQKVRAAGLDPNHWYAVEHDKNIAPGKVVEVKFWKTSVALYRTERGELHAIEDRCAHRQVKLSIGQVAGDRLVCGYHGWAYDGAGKLADVPHELFGRKLPNCKLRTYPLRVRYGLIWIFFGDPERAVEVPMPEIPELEGAEPWPLVTIDNTWSAHHSIIIDNVSDFTHAFLHRKYRPFSDAKLTKLEAAGDKVSLSYDSHIGGGKVTGLFVDRSAVNTNAIDLCYDYPYQWSNTGGSIKHFLSLLPIDERTTRAFFLFYFRSFKVPFLPVTIPRRITEPLLEAAKLLHIGPLLDQDGWACSAEQEGYERHFDAPLMELNPAVDAFQRLTIRKWEEHLAREAQRKPRRAGGLPVVREDEAAPAAEAAEGA
ncbi:aromatic ring-hydroxylating oxygenase subunit alpha [Polyangium aurulentum]|uniref:aromatic ring-hydroxylating oxygenase subunit alpha n=1 Tax=Polyangium aurulentum TaxID=2567896 RepID=UPI0010AE8D5C|nr:aromatic ring-hydroxylating dioxygenase subunit alpha [Polyangium aurulentum]UQA55162.1 aromatic ring-hydroxylating dioxygenase subunit alpha [Polyangium aurulentum]